MLKLYEQTCVSKNDQDMIGMLVQNSLVKRKAIFKNAFLFMSSLNQQNMIYTTVQKKLDTILWEFHFIICPLWTLLWWVGFIVRTMNYKVYANCLILNLLDTLHQMDR